MELSRGGRYQNREPDEQNGIDVAEIRQAELLAEGEA